MKHSIVISLFFLLTMFFIFNTEASQSRRAASIEGEEETYPIFPLQLTANITITAHQIEPESEFPPRIRHMLVYYDYSQKRARAEIASGYEAAKVYIRRYDLKNEYMVRLPPINDCKRSYLGEVMPFPDLPDARFIRRDKINGRSVHYFLHEDYGSRIHIYLDAENNAPVKLVQESEENDDFIPMLTYDFTGVIIGPPANYLFDVPSPFTHKTCDRHVGGFPYLHIFHYFVRF